MEQPLKDSSPRIASAELASPPSFSYDELIADSDRLLVAAKYIETKLVGIQPVLGESEYVLRNVRSPDRRLSYPDQKLARKVIAISRERLGF